MKKLTKYLNRETITYLITGILTTAISFGIYGGMVWLGFGVVAANTTATVLAVAFAFVVNKIVVFRSVEWVAANVLRELLSFCGGRVVTYLLETALLVLTVDKLGLPHFWCKCGASVLVIIVNYFISKWVVFTKQVKHV